MRQYRLYKDIIAYCKEHSIGVSQVRDATRAQIESTFGVNTARFSNKQLLLLKTIVIAELEEIAEIERSELAQSILREELGLPSLVVEKQFTTDKPLYFVWPQGKPVNVEEEQ